DDGISTPIDAPRPSVDAPRGADASLQADAAALPDAADLRTQTIALAGRANGAFWDDAAQTLYFTDQDAFKLMSYTDAAGVQVVTDLPANAAGINPGGIAQLADGSLATPNFGPGNSTANVVFVVDPVAKTAKATSGLDTTHHRIGMGFANGTLY